MKSAAVVAGVSPAKTQQSTLNNLSRRSAPIGPISPLANHTNKFFHALTRRTQSYDTHPNLFTPNSTPVSHSGLRAGHQELPRCPRCRTAIVSIGHTFNSADYRLSHRSRDL